MIAYKNIEFQRLENQKKNKAKYNIKGNEYFAEEAAINYYESLGYKAIWAENVYWWTLMSLFLWDVIFAKIKGSVSIVIDGVQTELDPAYEEFEQLFNQTIQMNGMPHDFFTPEFYERRESLIKNKIQELQHSNLEQKLKESFEQNRGKNCRAIENWDKYKIDELLISVQRLDKEKIIKILERLISDFCNNRAGLPDLIIYDDKDLFFSEVKSEKDKISEKQKNWHDFLSTTLKLKVEIFLINHTNDQLKHVKTYYTPISKEVIVSFGYSSSKKREEAIKFIQDQETYFTIDEGEEQIHGAKFEIDNIERLYKILDLTSGWKTQKIEIDGEIIKSTNLRNSLWCFREKIEQNASSDYCKKREYDNKTNKFGCRNIKFYELEYGEWRNYGYVDSTKGEWIFDYKKINEKAEEEINTLKYCPFFEAKKVRNLVKKIPEKINPKNDKNWAFISNDYNKWFWYKNGWLSGFGKTNFPGFSVMIGIKKLSKKEVNDAIKFSTGDTSIKISYREIYKKDKPKSGCFIATAVYGDSEAYQVKILRIFRDNYLKKNIFGKLFINAYYKTSPPIAVFIKRYKILTNLIKNILDMVVKIIKKRDL